MSAASSSLVAQDHVLSFLTGANSLTAELGVTLTDGTTQYIDATANVEKHRQLDSRHATGLRDKGIDSRQLHIDLHSEEHDRQLCRQLRQSFIEAKTPAFIGRRIQHHQFTVDADIEFEQNNGGTAGLMLVKNNMRQIYLSRDSAGATAWQCYKGKRQRLGSVAIPAQSIDITLRVTSDGKTFSFFAKAGKGGWLTVAKDVDARFLSTRSASGFTSTTIGMYAEK